MLWAIIGIGKFLDQGFRVIPPLTKCAESGRNTLYYHFKNIDGWVFGGTLGHVVTI